MTVDFNDYFWGEKNNGFDVLYHNMKYGLVASKELSDFFREKSNLAEHNSKSMTKLANKVGSGCIHGTFAPVWVVLKSSAERLSSLHLQMVQKISELVKDVSKYADELHKKHKCVKEEEAGTLEAVQAMQASTIAVQKAKDLYSNRIQEIEKLRKDSNAKKELEKAETKLKKQQDDYRNLLEKHNPVKIEFERRMTTTCRRFQEIEETHLKQMKEFLSTYIELLQNNHDMVGQVHSEFKRQFLEMTVEKLLEQFVLSKYTGLEKPEIIELDIANWSTSSPNLNTTTINQSNNTLQSSSTATGGGGGPNSILTGSPDLSSGAGPASSSSLSSNTVTKKEPLLRNWFISSLTSQSGAGHNAPSSSATSNVQATAITTTSPRSNSPSTNLYMDNQQEFNSIQSSSASSSIVLGTGTGVGVAASSSTSLMNAQQQQQQQMMMQQQTTGSTTTSGVGQVVPSTKSIFKSNNGDNLNEKNNKMAIDQQHQQQQSSQSKSSRRTTSLLNLFMSNSQGSRESRGSRDSSSIEVISAPTSPSEQTNQNNNNTNTNTNTDNNSNIGRNPLRGSKFSAILRSGRNKTKVNKKLKKKKDSIEISGSTTALPGSTGGGTGGKDDNICGEDEHTKNISISNTSPTMTINQTNTLTSTSSSALQSTSLGNVAPTAVPEVDEDGYCIQPKDPLWETQANKKEAEFYSDSDSDSDDGRVGERKIHVEIKPLNNGIAPISASVDELRATVETLSLSPLGGVLSQHHQSPGASNASTPTTTHPYAPLQSPTLSVSNTSRYADLGDIFSSEIGDITSVSAPPSATLLSKLNRQIPTPTSSQISSIAIPRPPSRRSEQVAAAAAAAAAASVAGASAVGRGRISPSSISRADSVGSLEFRTASIGIGSSRGPSPLTIGMADTIPLAVAFHEIVHAYFRGSDENRCQVKMSGDMMLSFPAGIVNVFANNPNPAKLCLRLKNIQNLDNLLPNKQLVSIDKLHSTNLSTMLEFNMIELTALLRRQAETNPTASYFNVDILKYQIKQKMGATSCPFQLVSYWKCESTHTDIKIDYKYNSRSMATASPLLNVSVSVPVDGGVKNVQSKPHSAWLGESNRLVWNFTDISQHSENHGVGTLRARLEIANGPSTPSILNTQFNCEGTTLSGIEFELIGNGYRTSLVKRRFISGKYICEGDGVRNITTPTPTPSSTTTTSSNSPNSINRIGG